MAPSKLRKAIGAVKDQTSIGLAKVGNRATLSDLDVAIVKATRHDEHPAEEKHIREILSLTCYSRSYINACVSTISRRLNKTKNWIVALKTLMLVQRLLTDGDPAYEQEIFFATRRGTRLLNMSDFRDTSRSHSWDYSAFVRTYALYLDEVLDFRMQGQRGKRTSFRHKEEEKEASPTQPKATPLRDMKNEYIFSKIQHLMQLLERFLACRPTGAAKHNRVVVVALYPIVKESFKVYYDMTETMGIIIERLRDLEVADSAKAYEIFCRVAKQFDELDVFYGWCKSVGIARASEFPDVDIITSKKLEAIDKIIRDKSASIKNKKLELPEATKNEKKDEQKEPEDIEEDMNNIKALPPPEGFPDEKGEVEEIPAKAHRVQEADLLNLGADVTTTEEHSDKLALALFDGGPATTNGPATSAWEAFNESGDWETTLVQSASHLSNQRASLPGGFDMMLLDAMYQHGATSAATASSGYAVTGSTSSVAIGSAGRPAMLALPAPLGGAALNTSMDPFAASFVVAPPPYVQMWEIEKKQRLLMEEQLMWQQYARDGRSGIANFQQHPYPYNMGGYTHTF